MAAVRRLKRLVPPHNFIHLEVTASFFIFFFLKLLLDVAKHKNAIPLPLIKPIGAPILPPDRYCLMSSNFMLSKRSAKRVSPGAMLLSYFKNSFYTDLIKHNYCLHIFFKQVASFKLF